MLEGWWDLVYDWGMLAGVEGSRCGWGRGLRSTLGLVGSVLKDCPVSYAGAVCQAECSLLA